MPLLFSSEGRCLAGAFHKPGNLRHSNYLQYREGSSDYAVELHVKAVREGKPMGKYQPATGVEAETEPGSQGRVLRNRLGITRKSAMDSEEYQRLLPGAGDGAHLCNI